MRRLIFRVLVMAYLVTGGLGLLYGTLAFAKRDVTFLGPPWLMWAAGILALLLGLRLEAREARAARDAAGTAAPGNRVQRLLAVLAVALVVSVLVFILTLSITSSISVTTTVQTSTFVTSSLTKLPATPAPPANHHVKEAREIWGKFVPKNGHARTVQGELLRAVEKLRDEACRNGNMNWDARFESLLKFLSDKLLDPQVFSSDTLAVTKAALAKIGDYDQPYTDDDLYDALGDRVVEYYRYYGSLPFEPNPNPAKSEGEDTGPTPRGLGPKLPGTFRVSAIQFASKFGDVKGNRERLADCVRTAAREGAQIVVMPEAAIPGYTSHDLKTTWRDPVRRPNPQDGRSLNGVAESVPGESTDYFGLLAEELKVYIVATLIEKEERDGRVNYFNTVVLLGPDGEIRLHYRKLHPWPPGEATWAQPGDKGLGVCETEFGKLGVMICYDLSSGVPEKLKAQGVTTVLYPIGWVCPKAEDWFDEMLPEKVKDWGLNLVGANWSLSGGEAEDADWQGFGHSRLIGADGKVLARGGSSGNEIIYADLPVPGPAR